MYGDHGFLLNELRGAFAVLLLGAFAASATAQDESAARVRYARAEAAGAKVRNLADPSGVAVTEVPAGGLLAVVREQADWLQVEVPGGFPVWVYGEYLRPVAEAGMLEVVGKDVRQRPLPSSSTDNYPLSPTLARGTRVRFLAQGDATKALAQDWIKVVSTPGTRGWVAKSEVKAVPENENGSALWAKAVIDAAAKTPTVPVPGGEAATARSGAAVPAAAATASKDARDALRKADQLLDAERAKFNAGQTPDYAAVRKSYEEVLTLAGNDPDMKQIVATRMKEVDLWQEATEIQSQVESDRATYDAAKVEREKRMVDAQKFKDQYAGRFDARGWVERRQIAGQQAPMYLLRYGGDPVAEIICNSDRFEIESFVDYDIGINGRELRPADTTSPIAVRPRVIDISRIEILGARPGAR